ncbi:hypothetical protein HK096_004165, partial [Nowakowskiella sp. JEL0078]
MPVQIYINNVYLLATPCADTDYEPKVEEDRSHALKQEKIKTWEAFRKTGNNTSDESTANQNATFANQVATKIVDNFQVTIKNIHIRYEDHIHKFEPESETSASTPSNKFSLGITLAELSAVSTNEDWIEKIMSDHKGIIHKLVKMKSLAAYWNTNNESLFGRLPNEYLVDMIKITKGVTTKVSSIFDFDHLNFALDDGQYSSLLDLVSSCSMHIKSLKYRKFRPSRSITPLVDPKAWFKYAATCILNDIHEKRKKWTWAYFEERRNDRVEYIRLYKFREYGKLTGEDMMNFNNLERKLTFRDITFYRSMGDSQMKKEKLLYNEEAKAKADQQKPDPVQNSWIDWWFKDTKITTNSKTQSEHEDKIPTLTENQIQELYKTVDFDPEAIIQEIS